MKTLKKILKALLILVIVLLVLVGGLLTWLTIVEYKPEDTEVVPVQTVGGQAKSLAAGDSVKFVAWNIGYGALGDNADFFMDGGKMVYTGDEARVRANMDNIVSEIKAQDPDILLLQEIDLDSSRESKSSAGKAPPTTRRCFPSSGQNALSAPTTVHGSSVTRPMIHKNAPQSAIHSRNGSSAARPFRFSAEGRKTVSVLLFTAPTSPAARNCQSRSAPYRPAAGLPRRSPASKR